MNEITVKIRYSLTITDSSFEPLWDAKIFTKLDLRNAYNLVRIREGDRGRQHLRPHLDNLRICLSALPVARHSLWYAESLVIVYLDDILILSWSGWTHPSGEGGTPEANKLFVKLKKCEFYIAEVSFMGFFHSPVKTPTGLRSRQLRTGQLYPPRSSCSISWAKWPSSLSATQPCTSCIPVLIFSDASILGGGITPRSPFSFEPISRVSHTYTLPEGSTLAMFTVCAPQPVQLQPVVLTRILEWETKPDALFHLFTLILSPSCPVPASLELLPGR